MIPPTTLWRSFQVWRAWKRGSPIPLAVTYFVNEQCNLRCRGCFFFEHPPDPIDDRVDLDTPQSLELIDDIAALGVPFLELVGGEPFLRRDLLELARHARDRGLWCGVTTNGMRLTPELALEARAVLRTVFVSIDGFEAAHDVVRGPGTYGKAMEGLDRLLASRGPALVGVSTIVGPENVATLPAFAHHLRERGVQQLVISSGLAPAPMVDPVVAAAPLASLKAMRGKDPGFLPQDDRFFDALLGFYRGQGRYGCHVDQLLHVAISPAGQTSACCTWPVPLGSAKNGALARTLAARAPGTFEPVERCTGCVRHDYAYTLSLFESRLPSMLANALRVALRN